MNIQSLIEAIYAAIGSTFSAAHRNWQCIVNFIAIVTAIVVFGQSWFSFQQCRLVLFVGAAGSSTANVGPDVVEKLRKTRDPSGVNYIVELEQVPNGISIRDRMAMESSRVPLGIIEDGPSIEPGERSDFRALLPMEWDYLFVLCSRKFLNDCRKSTGKAVTEMDLSDVADIVGKGRLFLGPKNSMSYTVAKAALKKYGDPKPEQQAIGFTDWEQMRAAFEIDQLDLAFYSGPLGADLISNLAEDGKVVLIGLGKIADAIQLESGFQMHAAKLPENLGKALTATTRTAKVPESDAVTMMMVPEIPFCRANLTTLASRRVLACPSSLSTADAFLIAQVAQSALENNEFNINLNATDPPFNEPPQAIKPVEWPLRIRPHTALQLLQKNQSPTVWRNWTTWPSWLQSAILGLIVLFAIDAIRWIAKRENAKAAKEWKTSVNPEFRRIELLFDDYEKAMEEKTYQETAKERTTWDDRLRDVRKSIRSNSSFTDSERELLLKRYEVLKAEIESSLNWAAQAPLKRRDPKIPVEIKSVEGPQ